MLSPFAVIKQNIAWLDLLKVALTVGIVLRHASLPDIDPSFTVFGAISKGIIQLTELCVPLFFVISGYLFFLNVPEKPTLAWFGDKLWKRVFSLLIPYLIANVLAFAFYWLAMRYMPSMVSGFFGDNWKNPLYVFWTGPINLSLWFIRDLIIACVCAPLIYLLLHYTRWWGVLALGLLWFFGYQRPWTNFFFTLGAGLALFKVDVEGHCCSMGPWMVLAFICAFFFYFRNETGIEFVILTGLPVCVWAASALVKIGWQTNIKWRGWAFFIYLYHYIPMIGAKKALVQFIHPSNDFALIAIYLSGAVVVLCFLTLLYFGLRKLAPRLLSFLVGGK